MTKNSSTLRQRFKSNYHKNDYKDNSYDYKKGNRNDFDSHFISTSYFFALLGLMILVLISAIIIEKQLPVGLKIVDEPKNSDRFIAERAYNILKNLTALGPRISGSYTNEVLAVNVLKKEIDSIIANAKENNVIQLDIQKASGAFRLEFLDGMTNVYRNMQNVIVKIGSKINSPHSLLLNCHFDSVSQSPGASDDGAGCAVMLEILRVISQSNRILRHNIIFLFNGGEENFLPASHGFITQHKWATEVRAFINIEACGAGGREVLFQAGPNHPWILETYSEEVPYPYASSMAQEIFQSGIIPGDTDYRIFRDFGNLSGLDFAWSANGYVYHTRFDTIDQIPLGTLQRTGDNILALARGMAQGHQLSNIESHRAGNLVYFDLLGAFVVRWPMSIADLINISSVILSFYSIYDSAKQAYKSDAISSAKYTQKLIQCLGAILASILAAIAVGLFIAILLNALGRTMSWYARPFWIIFLYVVPTTLVALATLLFHSKSSHKDITSSTWAIFKLYYNAYQLFWTIMLLIGIVFRIRSSFVSLFWVLFPTVGALVTSKVFDKLKGGKWLLFYISYMGLPFVQCVYFTLSAVYLCIPIMGRSGAGFNSELLIAGMVCLLYCLLASYVVPLILLVQNADRVFSILLGMFLLSLAVLILTPLGFPYSGDPTAPAPQRFMIAHTARTFHDQYGNVVKHDSGYWFADMDINSPHSIDRYVPEVQKAKRVDEDCTKYLYCGLPYIVPAQNFIFVTHWLEGTMPVVNNSATLRVLRREKIVDGERITVSVTGPAHTSIMISPVLEVELKSWSVVEGIPLAATPLWNNRKTYFIYYCYAGDSQPFQFSMDFKIPKEHSGPIIDIAVSGHYQFDPISTDFANMLEQFPSWTAVTYWSATYASWVV